MKGDMSHVTVKIESASGMGGVYPFVVACYDNDLRRELHKTAAAESGDVNVWEESFEINLQTEEKARKADNVSPPVYLTFFAYDTGTPGAPSLGSAGVLLDNVRQNGIAEGDFPVVNGSGTLKLTVDAQQGKKWYKSNAAKYTAGAVGVGAVAAGLGALVVGKKKKNQKKQQQELQQRQGEDSEDDDDDDDDDGHGGPAGNAGGGGGGGGGIGQRIAGALGHRGEHDGDDDDDDDAYDDDDGHDGPIGTSRA